MRYKFLRILLTTSRHGTESSNSVRKYYSDPIPLDLLIEILSRVPAKSIARLRCVSKSWASILCRPDFVDYFLTKSLTRPRLFFALKANDKLFFYSSHQPQNQVENSSLVATCYHKYFPDYFPSDICSPVCGLVLLQGYGRRRKVQVINPATGEFITLPKVLLKPKKLTKVEAESYPDKIAGFYFGYDPIGKQFKVVCMTTSCDERPNTHLVLTLETGKRSWRRIETKFHFVRNSRIRGEICINGVLYFGAVFDHGSTVIVAFDVRSEKFSFINTVEYMSLRGAYLVSSLILFNYKGKLGIHADKEGSWRLEAVAFWVLEDAVNHKWSKHAYGFSHLGEKNIVSDNEFVGMTGTGEMVWLRNPGRLSGPFYLLYYNLESKTFTKVNIQGFQEFKKDHFISPRPFLDYVENLKFM